MRATLLPSPPLRAFADGLIDYAGLFPPAALTLDAALDEFAASRRDDAAWMLARFIARSSDLPGITARLDRLGDFPMTRFVVLGRGADAAAGFAPALDDDLAAIAAFRSAHGVRAAVDGFEVRLPPDTFGSASDLASLLGGAAARLTSAGLLPFFEVPAGAGFRDRAAAAIGGLAGLPPLRAGFKLRCGGTVAAAFPSIDDVAFTVAAVAAAGVPFKATAGLHHPVRRFDPALGVTMHGFFNVFGAGLLAVAHRLDEGAVRPIVAEDDSRAFTFDDERFAWRDLAVDVDRIRRIRRDLFAGFGSCSFAEPKDDLAGLGLLPRPAEG